MLWAIVLLVLPTSALEPEAADPVALRRVAALRCPDATYDLGELLAWQRRSYPGAVVTSGFYAPRGRSRYRSQPGLHLGYDVAMPAGTRVLAAWSGRVTAVVPWAKDEWGVVVVHPDDTTATYGHIIPAVAPGARVAPGTSLGTVAVDHLDVKMLGADGQPLDYGFPRGPGRERLLVEWWLERLARGRWEALQKEAGRASSRLEKRFAARARGQELGLWTPAQLRRLDGDLRTARANLRSAPPPDRAEKTARRAGLAWSDVETLAERWGLLHPELKESPAGPRFERGPLGSWK